MTRQIIPDAAALIQFYEKCRLTAYQDPGGVWTIGWGHTGKDVYEGQVITQEEADSLFQRDISWAEDYVNNIVKNPLSDNQFGALVSLVFNIGVGNFAKSTLLKMLNDGDYKSAVSQFLVWDKIEINGKFVDSADLEARRAREAQLFLKDQAENSFITPQASVTPSKTPLQPFYATKAFIGLSLATLAYLADTFVGVNFIGIADKIDSYAYLGSWVHWLSFAVVIGGLSLTAYGRILARQRKGI